MNDLARWDAAFVAGIVVVTIAFLGSLVLPREACPAVALALVALSPVVAEYVKHKSDRA